MSYLTILKLQLYGSIQFQVEHCIKSVRVQSFSGPHFPAFGLNMERSLSIFSPNAGKYGPEYSEYGHFSRSGIQRLCVPNFRIKTVDQPFFVDNCIDVVDATIYSERFSCLRLLFVPLKFQITSLFYGFIIFEKNMSKKVI